MNERIAELYNRAIVLEGNGDYTAGELDPVKFAELIVKKCADIVQFLQDHGREDIADDLKKHFGVEE